MGNRDPQGRIEEESRWGFVTDISVNGKPILKGIDLDVKPGKVHAIMGPNGSGKSTLAQVLAGREGYEVTRGSVRYLGRDLLDRPPEERARDGIFLAFQYPLEVPGVANAQFLRTALNSLRRARGEDELDAFDFLEHVKGRLALMEMGEDLLYRSVNEGFSHDDRSRPGTDRRGGGAAVFAGACHAGRGRPRGRGGQAQGAGEGCEVTAPPAYEAVASLPVRVVDGQMEVRDDRWD